MKKLLVLSLCVLVFAVVGCKKKTENAAASMDNKSATASSEEVKDKSKTFIVGLDDSFPPMGFRDENNKIVGFDIDMATEVAKRMGKELVLQPIDWSSKELELNNDKIDCIWNGLSVDPVRAEAMLLSKPYLANNMVYVVMKDSLIKSNKDITDKTELGVQAGSTAVKSCEKDPVCAKAKLNQYENNVLALSDLNIGRVKGVVMDEVVARYFITKNKSPYVVLADHLEAEHYAVGFKKDNTALAQEVEKALAVMAEEGVSDNISIKWFGENIILK